LEENKKNTDASVNVAKSDPVIVAQFKAITTSPLNPNGLNMSTMSNDKIIQTLQLLGQTADSDKRQAMAENNPAKQATADKRLEDLNAFLSACKITWDNVNDYTEFMRLDELNRSKQISEATAKTTSSVRESNFAINTTGKQTQTAAKDAEDKLAKLRDIVPRRNVG
jgi:hypothetical protein